LPAKHESDPEGPEPERRRVLTREVLEAVQGVVHHVLHTAHFWVFGCPDQIGGPFLTQGIDHAMSLLRQGSGRIDSGRLASRPEPAALNFTGDLESKSRTSIPSHASLRGGQPVPSRLSATSHDRIRKKLSCWDPFLLKTGHDNAQDWWLSRDPRDQR